MYDGTLPQSISAKIGVGIDQWKKTEAVTKKDEYYLIVEDSKLRKEMYIYNTKLGLWCKHRARSFFTAVEFNGKVHFTDGYEDIEISDEPVEWYVTTGTLSADSPDSKYINRLDIRMQLDGTARAFVEYDSNENWVHLGTVNGQGLKSFTFPILPRRCDHFRLKLQGKGKVKIFSITKSVKGAGK